MRVAIVGASGAVGQEFLRVLEERNFPAEELLLFGSQRSAGAKYMFRGKELEVKLLQHNDDFKGVDIAFTSAGAGVSREFADTITKHGAVMRHNSSPFLKHEDVLLVEPECKMKMFNETRKIMHTDAQCSAMCVRVPSLRSHSEAIWAETEEPVSPEAFAQSIKEGKGVQLMDDPANKVYPMPLFLAGKDDVYVGRIRKDLANENGITFWLVGDQIKKGAALNAVQIAEYLIEVGNVK